MSSCGRPRLLANRKPIGHFRSLASSQSPLSFSLSAPGIGQPVSFPLLPPVTPKCVHLLPQFSEGWKTASQWLTLFTPAGIYRLLTGFQALHCALNILILFNIYYSMMIGIVVSQPGTEVLRSQTTCQDHKCEDVFWMPQFLRQQHPCLSDTSSITIRNGLFLMGHQVFFQENTETTVVIIADL